MVLVVCLDVRTYGGIKVNKKQKMNKKQKRKKRFKRFVITLFFAAVVVLFVLIYFVPNVGETLQKTRVATYDNIQIMDNMDCYIIRDETVFFSEEQGAVKYSVTEGERVKKGSEVVQVHIQDIDPTTESKLEVINQRIERLQNGENLFQNDITKIDELIQANINDLRELKEDGNIEGARKIEEKIKRYMDKKNIIINNTGLKNSNIEVLEEERNSLQKVINQSVISYRANYPGIISYCIDAYENELTPMNMYLLDKQELEKMDGAVQDTTREKTKTNEPIYKIVNSSVWYVAGWVTVDKVENYIQGNSVSLNLPDGQTKGIIYDIIMDEEFALVLIQMDHYYPEFWKNRKFNSDIIVADYEGLKIDNDSIAEVDEQKGVYVVDINGDYSFKPIKVIGTDGNKTIVESGYYYIQTEDGLDKVRTINLYDEVLRNASKNVH